jgi:hypothetical protein
MNDLAQGCDFTVEFVVAFVKNFLLESYAPKIGPTTLIDSLAETSCLNIAIH